MKFYILNDIHVEFETFDPPKVDADAIILAGDIHVKNKAVMMSLLLWKGVIQTCMHIRQVIKR